MVNNWLVRRVSLQTLLIGGTQLVTILVLSNYTDILHVSSFPIALAVTVAYALSQWIFWYVFVRYVAKLPPWSYPVLMFAASGIFVLLATRVIPGFSVPSLFKSIEAICILTMTSTIAAVIFGMDDDGWFEFNVVGALVKRYGKAKKTTEPGFIYLEIDGLSFDVLKKAIGKGYMPTLKRWLATSHTLMRWETDLSSQTAAMQAGILEGNNTDVPAYRWYDRGKKRVIVSCNPNDTMEMERRLTTHRGLLEQGGSSRGNMFSGDAEETLFTFSTLLDKQRKKSPDFYLFLLNPYIMSRLVTKFFLEIIFEIKDGLVQWILDRKPQNVSRAFPYPLVRAFMNSLVPELVTHVGIIDIFRGVPAMYLLYSGYDDLAHFSGIDRSDSLATLASADACFARIERIVALAPRPYHIIVLSDHGQSQGVHFSKKYGMDLKKLVESLIAKSMNVYAATETNESSYLINSVLTDLSRQNLKTSKLLKQSLRSVQDQKDEYVNIAPTIAVKDADNAVNQKDADVVVLASGCLGLIYAGRLEKRATYEQIEALLPNFLQGLASSEGIGFVLVQSNDNGGLVIGKNGRYHLETGRAEGVNPLTPYGKHAAEHLRKVNTYENAPDVLVNTAYDESTGEISGFEKQVGHHGGLGGYQNRPFLLYPASLPMKHGEEIVGAVRLYTILHAWRNLSVRK